MAKIITGNKTFAIQNIVLMFKHFPGPRSAAEGEGHHYNQVPRDQE